MQLFSFHLLNTLKNYLFLCLFFLSLFLRLCVFILARLRFFRLAYLTELIDYVIFLNYFLLNRRIPCKV